MSLPLTRRIAKTVLLTAAGAASVVGTAGAASAAELPTTADVGGLSNLDSSVGSNVGGTATEGAQALAPMSSNSPLDTSGVPDAGVSAGTENARAAHEAGKLVGDTATGAQTGAQKQTPHLQQSVPDVRTRGLPTDSMPQSQPALGNPVTPEQDQAKKQPTRTLLPNGLGLVSLSR